VRRFVLTYIRGNQATDIEGVQFSSGKVFLERHPFGNVGIALFRSISRMEDELSVGGTTSIKWLDEEVSL